MIETERTEDCSTIISRQPYEPHYSDKSTLQLGRELKITVVLLSLDKDIVEERPMLADGTLDGGPIEVTKSGYITIRYDCPEQDVCFVKRSLNNQEIQKLIQPKLQELARLPNYKIVGNGYDGWVAPGDIGRAKVKLSVARTR